MLGEIKQHTFVSCCVGGRKWPNPLIGMRFLLRFQPPTPGHTPTSQEGRHTGPSEARIHPPPPSCQAYPCLHGGKRINVQREAPLLSLLCTQGEAKHVWDGPCGQESARPQSPSGHTRAEHEQVPVLMEKLMDRQTIGVCCHAERRGQRESR